ncbi:MAG: class I SAM-dependent methyltransferase [Alphaproteobacteria bacterium]|nr:class I SAM-dependent methyltransferase [Alphaproteobacteria bacterium]
MPNTPPPFREITCPACAHHVAVPFLDAETMPLATLAWPESRDEAVRLDKLLLDFVQCVGCSHVFNAGFDYHRVPYSRRPNLMFNKGASWAGFIEDLKAKLGDVLSEAPTVIEIGYGDGSFLGALAEIKPEGRFIGFDPNGATAPEGSPLELHSTLFDPGHHMAAFAPDLIVSRHVLEHLTNPLGFVQALSFASLGLDNNPMLYIEVPCIDRAIETGRTTDFYFEHNSQFTTRSFRTMLSRCGVSERMVNHGYDGEVVFALVELGTDHAQGRTAEGTQRFRDRARAAGPKVRDHLAALTEAGKKIAIWGGTGKAAAFINRYGLDAEAFPTVVDSDPAKVGTHVPGTGQAIQYRDILKSEPVDVVLIPPQWRAKDIIAEMNRVGIPFAQALIEHDGKLVDFLTGDHPYAKE